VGKRKRRKESTIIVNEVFLAFIMKSSEMRLKEVRKKKKDGSNQHSQQIASLIITLICS
jgi:hypothetical protein